MTASHGVEERSIVLSAGTAQRRSQARDLAARLFARSDWERMTAILTARRLLPTLGPRLVDLAGAAVDERFAEAVSASLEQTRRQDTLIEGIGSVVVNELTQAGIRSVVLKGPALGAALYGEAGRRPSSDIDLLVAKERIAEAVEIVRRLGYSAPGDRIAGNGGLPLLHFALVHEQGTLPPVELHWRIHWYEEHFARECLLGEEGASSDWGPSRADELVALLLFYARDGLLGLRYPTDIGAWWDLHATQLSGAELAAILRAYPRLERAVRAAAIASGRVTGAPIDTLLPRSAPVLRRRLAVGLSDPLPRASEAQVYASMGLVDGLLAPRGGLGSFARRQFAPPGPPLVPKRMRDLGALLLRSVTMLGRYAVALLRPSRTF